MYGAYGAGKTILCHSSDFTRSGLIETSVCHDNTDGCIAGKLVFYDRIASIHILGGWTKAGLFPVQHTGNHFPRFPVINVTQRVYCDQCSNLQLTNLDGMASDTGFHAIAHPPILSDRCPCTRTVVSISIISFFRRDASGIRHMGIGTDSTISNGQIKQARLAYKGYFGHSYVKPDVPFLQITHPPTSRIQTKRTSSAQHDRVYFVGACKRRKQACLSRCGSTSANTLGQFLLRQQPIAPNTACYRLSVPCGRKWRFGVPSIAEGEAVRLLPCRLLRKFCHLYL